MSAQRKLANPAIRISPASHAKLQALAANEDRSMADIMNELIDRYEREAFWREVNASVERLRAEEVEEIRAEARAAGVPSSR